MWLRLRVSLVSLLFGLFLLVSLLHFLRPLQASHAAAGDVYCVVPLGDSTGPFAACDQVFDDIQMAMDTAVGGEEIRLATGVYTNVQTRNNQEQIIYLDKDVNLSGGYVPPFTAAPDPVANPTILDALTLGRVVNVVTDTVSTISGLQMTGGNATGQGNGLGKCADGGGLFSIGAILTLTQNIISHNVAESFAGASATGCGGGLTFYNGTITLLDNTVQNNLAAAANQGRGGGINIENSSYFLDGNEVLDNMALQTGSDADSLGFGGGIYIANSSGTLNNNTVAGNKAVQEGSDGFGGGIYIQRFNTEPATLLLNNNIIQENVALVQPPASPAPFDSPSGHGGGLYLHNREIANTNFDIAVTNNQFLSNTAVLTGHEGFAGGMVMANASNDGNIPLLFENNRVVGNTAVYSITSSITEGFGGGMILAGLDTTLRHNQYISNTAVVLGSNGTVGGIYLSRGSFTLQNEVIQGNVAVATGGGRIGGLGLDSVAVTLENVVVIDNQGDETGGIWIDSSEVTLSHVTLARNGSGTAVTLRDPAQTPGNLIDPSTVTFTNGIIADQPIGFYVEADNSLQVDGVLWHQVPTTVTLSPMVTFAINNQFTGDPLFSADGYHITKLSPARFQGVASSVVQDIDGEGRPSPPSQGADEFWTNSLFMPIVFR